MLGRHAHGLKLTAQQRQVELFGLRSGAGAAVCVKQGPAWQYRSKYADQNKVQFNKKCR